MQRALYYFHSYIITTLTHTHTESNGWRRHVKWDRHERYLAVAFCFVSSEHTPRERVFFIIIMIIIMLLFFSSFFLYYFQMECVCVELMVSRMRSHSYSSSLLSGVSCITCLLIDNSLSLGLRFFLFAVVKIEQAFNRAVRYIVACERDRRLYIGRTDRSTDQWFLLDFNVHFLFLPA